jgi:hypothetical protein
MHRGGSHGPSVTRMRVYEVLYDVFIAPSMSAVGHQRSSGDVSPTSATRPRAAQTQTFRHFAFVPQTKNARGLRAGSVLTDRRLRRRH